MIGPSVFAKLCSLFSDQLTNSDGTIRIYPNYQSMADKVYPALAYDCENYEPDDCMDGTDGVPSIDVKIYAIGETYDQADALGRLVAIALDGTAGTWGATTLQGCFVTEVAEDHFVDTDLETILYFVKEVTCKVTYLES
jgi:hypothetical protein